MPILSWILAALLVIVPLPDVAPVPMTSLSVTIDSAHRSPSVQALPMGALPGLGKIFAGTPKDLGLEDGQLSPCPDSPNCVVSQNADPEHAIAPIAYQTTQEDAYAKLLEILSVVPRTTVVRQEDRYIRAEASSRLLGFVDDVEFFFPTDENVIHMRSAARLGESDLGVNRRRLEQIRLAAQDLGL